MGRIGKFHEICDAIKLNQTQNLKQNYEKKEKDIQEERKRKEKEEKEGEKETVINRDTDKQTGRYRDEERE